MDLHHGQQLICHGYCVLLTNPDRTFTGDRRQGLFDHDTRVLSAYELLLDGVSPRVDSSGLLDAAHWVGRLTVARTGAMQMDLVFHKTFSNSHSGAESATA